MPKKKKEASNKKKKIEILTYTPEFESFWQAYPRRVVKMKAFEAYRKFLAMGVSHEVIIEGAKRYAIYIRYSAIEERFVKHPTTWLNGGCWDDEYPVGTPRQGTDGKTTYGDSIERAVRAAYDHHRNKEDIRH